MVEFQQEGDQLTALLSGELDHHSAAVIRQAVDFAVEEQLPKTLILDFGAVSFMDSAGIGLVLGRHKLMDAHGGTVTVRNPSVHIRKVMRLSGIDQIAKMETTQERRELHENGE